MLLDCQGVVRQLIFDGFHNGDTADNKFSSLKSYVDAFIDGETVCVLTHGVTGELFIYFKGIIWSFVIFLI